VGVPLLARRLLILVRTALLAGSTGVVRLTTPGTAQEGTTAANVSVAAMTHLNNNSLISKQISKEMKQKNQETIIVESVSSYGNLPTETLKKPYETQIALYQ
jgi:hypothetical protein